MKPVELPTLSPAASIAPSIDPEAVKMAYFSRLVYRHNVEGVKSIVQPLGYEVFQFQTKHKNAYIFANDTEIIVSHEGSWPEHLDAYARNLNHFHKAHPLGDKVHAGFYNEIHEPVKTTNCDFTSKPMIEAVHVQIKKLCKAHPNAKIHFTGHSSGGVAAILQAAHMIRDDLHLSIHRLESITTFGQPRLANPSFAKKFRDFCHQSRIHINRYVMHGDIIPTLPPAYVGYAYEHVGEAKELVPPQNSQKPYKSNNPFRNIFEYGKSRHSIGAYYQSCLEALKMNEIEYFDTYMIPQKSANEAWMNVSETLFFSKKPELIASDKEKIQHILDRLESPPFIDIPSDIQSDVLMYKDRLCALIKQWTPRTEAAGLKQAGYIMANFAKLTKSIPDTYDELKNLGEFAQELSATIERKQSSNAVGR